VCEIKENKTTKRYLKCMTYETGFQIEEQRWEKDNLCTHVWSDHHLTTFLSFT
jgi:hypothetical protein